MRWWSGCCDICEFDLDVWCKESDVGSDEGNDCEYICWVGEIVGVFCGVGRDEERLECKSCGSCLFFGGYIV